MIDFPTDKFAINFLNIFHKCCWDRKKLLIASIVQVCLVQTLHKLAGPAKKYLSIADFAQESPSRRAVHQAGAEHVVQSDANCWTNPCLVASCSS